MTLEEVKAKLEAKAAADAKALAEEEEQRENEYNIQRERLKEIQPRIQKILDSYDYAKQLHLEYIFNNTCVEIRWAFLAEGFYHKVGIMRDNNYMGIYAGGFCGPWDFYVNGEEFFFLHESNDTYDDAKKHIGVIKEFCHCFEQYEAAFYEIINKQIVN